jgi:hypothetical protein
MSSFNIKQGDYHRRIALDLTDVATTGATGVTFRVRSPSGVVTTSAGVIDSTTRVSYQFTAPQLDVAGVFALEAALTYADGTETVPTVGYVTVVVEPKLA